MSTASACTALGRARATHYRRHRKSPPPPRPAPIPHRQRRQPAALSPAERERLVEVLHSDRFVDAAPAQVWATLLDEGVYLASQRTMYRLLAERGETGDRRRQATHPAHVKPELVAEKPNSVWSWDITKLRGPKKWSYFYLYVILDVYSRYVVGWMVADCESAALAEDLITASCEKQRIDRSQLTIHADRGTSMTSKTVALLLADLGVTRSHSRPRVSNDNPYSEAQFKTLKYRPDYPTPSRPPAPGAARSSTTTTMITVTPGSGYSPRPSSTTARHPRSARPAPPSSTPPTPRTPNGSSASRPHRPCPDPPGSTDPGPTKTRHRRGRPRPANFHNNLPQRG